MNKIFTSFSSQKVDMKKGIIQGVRLISLGPAKGHGLYTTRPNLDEIAGMIRDLNGRLPLFIDHETEFGSAAGSLLNCRIDGDCLRGDIQLSESLQKRKIASSELTAWEYILTQAANEPHTLGLSLEFFVNENTYSIQGYRTYTVKNLSCAAIVDKPATNNGLFSSTSSKKLKTIAIDFDGTIVDNRFPEIGPAIPGAVSAIQKLKNDGHTLILYTCRCGGTLDAAIQWLQKQGILFDYVNTNLPENIKDFGGDTRKIYADFYIDDKSFGVSIDWGKILEFFNITPHSILFSTSQNQNVKGALRSLSLSPKTPSRKGKKMTLEELTTQLEAALAASQTLADFLNALKTFAEAEAVDTSTEGTPPVKDQGAKAGTEPDPENQTGEAEKLMSAVAALSAKVDGALKVFGAGKGVKFSAKNPGSGKTDPMSKIVRFK